MMRTEPTLAVATPEIRPSSVLLPLPLGPLINRRSPGATVKSSMSSTIGALGCQRN